MKGRRKDNSAATPTRFRLTPAGWLFALVTVLVGLAAFKNQSTLLYVLLGGMIAAMHLSAVIAVGSLRYLELTRQAPSRVWQNQTVPMAYYVRNRRRRWCLGLTIEEVLPRKLRKALAKASRKGATRTAVDFGQYVQAASGFCASLPPQTVFRAGARFVAFRRGPLSLGTVCVMTEFPFGLVRALRKFATDASSGAVVAWPAIGRLKRQLLPQGAVELSSAAPSRTSGGQDEFVGLREYRPDDNPRLIHWRRSATFITKNGQPVVREMARPRSEVLWIVVDTQLEGATAPTGPIMPVDMRDPWQRREFTLRFAATVLDYALVRGYQVGLALGRGQGSVVLPAAAGATHRASMLDALANVEDTVRFSLTDTIKCIRPGQLRQAQVLLISSNTQVQQQHAGDLSSLRRRCRHVVIHTADSISGVFEDIAPTPPVSQAPAAASPSTMTDTQPVQEAR